MPTAISAPEETAASSSSSSSSKNAAASLLNEIILEESDIPYEEELLSRPYDLRGWWRYLQHKLAAPPQQRFLLYERALKHLPGSYKLWKSYLDERRAALMDRPRSPLDPAYEQLNATFERALVTMHRMPRIWLDYCECLTKQKKITRTRHTFDRALRALPLTQHSRIWEPYLEFIHNCGVPESALRVYRRYLKLEPEQVEVFIDYLISIERYDEAAKLLAEAVNNDKFSSIRGKTEHQLWMDLTELCAKNAKDISGIKVEQIIRGGIRRFTDQRGKLWTLLAEYYLSLGNFEKARDIYEEGIKSVLTVRDFSQIFDAYAQTEETVLAKQLELVEQGANVDKVELELRMMRFESLMSRRPFLVNDVLLRQNPNNVHEWAKRVQLHQDNHNMIIETYRKAFDTIEPKKATGRLNLLWIGFAKFFETEQNNLEAARAVFEKAVKVDFKSVDDLAMVWCEYAEMEIRHDNLQEARTVMGRATAPPRRLGNIDYFDQSLSVQMRVHKSLKVWSLYVDLEECLGTVESTKSIYDRILDLKIATPQIVINYALFLEELRLYEDAFKAYERGVGLFNYPISFEIWNTYLTKFIQRYGGTKLERARDLFEQALIGCPPEFCKPLYLMYAKLEEDYGLARNAMKIYDRATTAVDDTNRFNMYLLYIEKAGETFGLTSTREIYERAINALKDHEARNMAFRYAELETKLGEIDRARVLYSYTSQLCDPRVDIEFWEAWRNFEIKYGNEDTFREMLRIKRSVTAKFNTEVNFLSAQQAALSKK